MVRTSAVTGSESATTVAPVESLNEIFGCSPNVFPPFTSEIPFVTWIATGCSVIVSESASTDLPHDSDVENSSKTEGEVPFSVSAVKVARPPTACAVFEPMNSTGDADDTILAST